jgi:hypothetical protein
MTEQVLRYRVRLSASDTGCRGFLVFASLPDPSVGLYLDYTTDTSFQILSNFNSDCSVDQFLIRKVEEGIGHVLMHVRPCLGNILAAIRTGPT